MRRGSPERWRSPRCGPCVQDADFAVRQLVDIGLQALSSAINDPTTAVEIILRLGSLLRTVLTAPLPPHALEDDADRILIQPWSLDHEEFVAHAFDQLRQSSLDQPEVVAALLRVVRMLIAHLQGEGCPERAPALERQMRLILDSVRDHPGTHPEDRERLLAIASTETDPADHTR